MRGQSAAPLFERSDKPVEGSKPDPQLAGFGSDGGGGGGVRAHARTGRHPGGAPRTIRGQPRARVDDVVQANRSAHLAAHGGAGGGHPTKTVAHEGRAPATPARVSWPPLPHAHRGRPTRRHRLVLPRRGLSLAPPASPRAPRWPIGCGRHPWSRAAPRRPSHRCPVRSGGAVRPPWRRRCPALVTS